MNNKKKSSGRSLTVLFSVFSLVYIAPIVIIIYNSFKKKAYITRSPFELPTEKTFSGLQNYVEGITKTKFWEALGTSLVVTVLSVVVILICTSMAAWRPSCRRWSRGSPVKSKLSLKRNRM